MKLRFTMRRLLAAFCLLALALAWMGANVRRAAQEWAFVTQEASADDSHLRGFEIGSFTDFDEQPPTLADWVWTALGQRERNVHVNVVGPQSYFPVGAEFEEEFRNASRRLDSFTTIRVTDLMFSAKFVPAGLGEAAWLKQVTYLHCNRCSLDEFPFNRLESLVEFKFEECNFTSRLATTEAFPHLRYAVLVDSTIDAVALGALARAPHLESLYLIGSDLPRVWNETRGEFEDDMWTDADLAPFADARRLTRLRIEHLRLTHDGLVAISSCPRLNELCIAFSEVRTTLDPLLSHPTLETLMLFGDLRQATLSADVEVGPCLKKIDLRHGQLSAPLFLQLDQLCRQRGVALVGSYAEVEAPPTP